MHSVSCTVRHAQSATMARHHAMHHPQLRRMHHTSIMLHASCAPCLLCAAAQGAARTIMRPMSAQPPTSQPRSKLIEQYLEAQRARPLSVSVCVCVSVPLLLVSGQPGWLAQQCRAWGAKAWGAKACGAKACGCMLPEMVTVHPVPSNASNYA